MKISILKSFALSFVLFSNFSLKSMEKDYDKKLTSIKSDLSNFRIEVDDLNRENNRKVVELLDLHANSVTKTDPNYENQIKRIKFLESEIAQIKSKVDSKQAHIRKLENKKINLESRIAEQKHKRNEKLVKYGVPTAITIGAIITFIYLYKKYQAKKKNNLKIKR